MINKNTIILFRFHKDFYICKERIRIIKHFNPKIPIYGLFGGDKSDWVSVKKFFSDSPIEELYISTNTDRYWKWLHPEQTLREWYKLYGYKLKFNFLIDEEWDILPTTSIDDLYKQMPDSDSVVLTGLENFDKVKNRWRWVMDKAHSNDFINFQKYIKEVFNIDKILYASLGPGQIFTPKFLEDFASLSLDMNFVDPVVSEIIYPVVAQILKYKVLDTGLYPGWSNREEAIKFFNCWYIPIEKNVILEELKKANGRRAFHPVKYQFLLEDIINN